MLQLSWEDVLSFEPIGEERTSPAHASISHVVDHLRRHEIVFVFDQSYSRAIAPLQQLRAKLQQFQNQGAHGFYYDSHARFLFASFSAESLSIFRETLLRTGLPGHRLVSLRAHAT